MSTMVSYRTANDRVNGIDLRRERLSAARLGANDGVLIADVAGPVCRTGEQLAGVVR
ncbi:hypothetical protein [Nocardioides sp. SYSU DS0663]|uniref:hypothetical protein n=1 Tax=Nocardioides sp. SYSU DS0663 TaxID=3416445 RepID=UPI003F4CAA1D